MNLENLPKLNILLKRFVIATPVNRSTDFRETL